MNGAPADDNSSVLDVLAGIYLQLRDTWRAALLERDCSADAPWRQWRDHPEDAPITARDLFMQYTEDSGMLAAQAITQHLGLLARAYWLDPADSDGSEWRLWLHAAPFAPARAVLEGTAMTGWLLDPALDPDGRVRRGAVLALWSRPRKYEADVEAAGFEVRRDGNGVRFVWSGEDSRPLTISTMVKAVHGKHRVSLHARWSKLLHNDPGETALGTAYRLEPDGRIGSGVVCEDEHLVLAGEVAQLLAEAGERQADYFGRSARSLVDTCSAIVYSTRQQVPADRRADRGARRPRMRRPVVRCRWTLSPATDWRPQTIVNESSAEVGRRVRTERFTPVRSRS